MIRSYLAATATVILALLIFCSGASAQKFKPVPVTPLPTIPNLAPTIPNSTPIIVGPVIPPSLAVPPVDRDRMACEAAFQAYNEQGSAIRIALTIAKG